MRSDKRNQVFNAIDIERRLQEGKFVFTCTSIDMSQAEKLTILAEEFGEVAHEINEGIGPNREVNIERLRKELVQVAAVAVAWIESFGFTRGLVFEGIEFHMGKITQRSSEPLAETFLGLCELFAFVCEPHKEHEPEVPLARFVAACVQWLETL